MNLLIVDDDAVNLKLLRVQLESEGHGVINAANGVEALEVLERGLGVDGIISDILMPEMDGFRLCLEIRKNEKFSTLPFIFYTSTYSSLQDRQLAKTVGADDYLSKPSPTRDILGALGKAIQKTRPRIAAVAAQHDESYVLKQYNASLVRKLEQRNTEIEETIKKLQIAHDSKQESEERFRAIFNHAGIGIVIRPAHDRTLPWTQVNDYFCELLGYTREELLKLSTADITPADEKASAVRDNERLLRGDIASYAREKQVIRKDGRLIWITLTVAALPGPDGRPANLLATYEEITARKEAEEKVRRLSRVHAVLSGTNAAIVRVAHPQELFQEVCRIAVEEGLLACAWIGSLDSVTLDITPVAWAGKGTEEMHMTKATARDDPPRGQGAVSRAVRERRAITSNNLALENFGGPRQDDVFKLGLQSMIALPLFEGDIVVGTFTLYARESGYFDEDEIALLTQLAGNVSFALEHMARQKKIEKLSRIRSVLGKINAAIVRIHDKQELFEETCRIAAEAGGFSFAWIGIHEPVAKQVRPVSWAGAADDYLDIVRMPQPVDGAAPGGAGLVATAVLNGTSVIVNDVQNDPRVVRKEMHLQRGTHSIAVLPLFVADQVAGILVLHALDPGFFDTEELALLFELAGDISFALQTIEKQEKLDYLSYYDSLTGLPNRTLFLDRAGQQMRARSGEPVMVALILINLERFRNINETYGRHGGDELLKSVARRLEGAFQGRDYLARIGADGFGVIMRGVEDPTGVLHAIENRIWACFQHPFDLVGKELRVAARLGIAIFPTDGTDADTLFKNAEAALKKAKESGESYLFYTADMNAHAAQILSLETRMRKAVEAQEFVLHYQPKYTLADGKICGLEALIRWQDPASGLVPPGSFIPLLEETGLILKVGQWALEKALAQRREWSARGCAVPRIAVNVSAVQLQQKNFSDVVIDVVQKQGGNPDALELEVTESLLMRDVQGSIHTLSILREMGISIAMDDFGTGYSSLAYISRLPINSLKIDRSFITAMTGSPQDRGIVTTIIALAHSMNLKVVAEGVETKEQLQLLKKLKCDEAQGYFFSKPLPPEETELLLRKPASKN